MADDIDNNDAKIASSEEDENFQILKQGAEARLYLSTFHGRETVIKERFPKKYRHPDLDMRLTQERMRAECRGIVRCKALGIRTPAIYFVDSTKNRIYLEYLNPVETVDVHIGKIIKEAKTDLENHPALISLAQHVGTLIGKFHQANIIHGDLTTSNILVDGSTEKRSQAIDESSLILIDFGLSHVDVSSEDKGVDLYVLEKAITSTHSGIPWFFQKILDFYVEANQSSGPEVVKKLEEIRLRGRKRTMVG